ncbi:MAG: DUF4056 domain-containing protein [Phycisphaeraceae bacterium]
MRWVVGLCVAAVLVLASGCASPPKPRTRTGSLPFPGLFTLYAVADVEDLDPHSYGMTLPFRNGSRGIFYTERAGFIDMSHVRWTIDWSWYYHQRVRTALLAEQERLRLATGMPSRLHMHFHYPGDWATWPADARAEAIDDLSLRIAQEAAWVLGLWYEFATYFGYASTVVLPESQSAFTYEDNFSHLIGLKVFEQALAEKDCDFDAAVTTALDAMLPALEPYGPDASHEAVLAVKDAWWRDGTAISRHFELGLDGEPVRPWLIPDEPGGPGRYGAPWRVPGMHDLEDPALRHFVSLAIEPRIWQASAIRRAAGTTQPHIRPDHFPALVEHVREAILDAHGPDADRP